MKSSPFNFLLVGLLANTLAFAQPTAPQKQILGEWLSPKRDTKVLVYQSNNLFFGKITWGSGSLV